MNIDEQNSSKLELKETGSSIAVASIIETPTEKIIETPPEETVEKPQKEISLKQKEETETALRLERNGEFLMEKRRFDEAMDFLRRAAVTYKKFNDLENLGRIYYFQGNCFDQQQKHTEAIAFYRESRDCYRKLDDKKNYGMISDKIAKVYYSQGKISESSAEYTDAIKFGSEMSEIFNNLAFLQISLKEFTSAEENLVKALELRKKEDSPEIHITFNNLGIIEYINEKYAEAEYYFRNGIDNDKRQPEEDRSIQYVVFAKPEFKGEKFELYKVFNDVNTKACLTLNLASALIMQNRSESVPSLVESAFEMDRDQAYLYESAGWIYLNLGGEDKALENFRKALPLDPVNEDLSRIIDLINPYLKAKVGRNDPCPCGSGKKYKKCHFRS